MRGSARVSSTLLRVPYYKSYFSSVLACVLCQCLIHRSSLTYSSVSVCGTCTKGILSAMQFNSWINRVVPFINIVSYRWSARNKEKNRQYTRGISHREHRHRTRRMISPDRVFRKLIASLLGRYRIVFSYRSSSISVL